MWLRRIAFTLLLALTASGCQFFGKQEEEVLNLIPGQLANGKSIVGTWSTSFLYISSDGAAADSSYAITETFTFDANGHAKIHIVDARDGGIDCNGSGQYQNVGSNNIVVYFQSVDDSNCPVAASIVMTNIEVSGKKLSFKNKDSGHVYNYVAVRAQRFAPVGVWDFDGASGDQNGEGGIDYLYLDANGYFVLQTHFDGEDYGFSGYYTVSGSSITLTFYRNGDPSDLTGVVMSYDQFVTNGTHLILSTTDENDQVVDYTGARL